MQQRHVATDRLAVFGLGLLLALFGNAHAQQACDWRSVAVVGAEGMSPAFAPVVDDNAWQLFATDDRGTLKLHRCDANGACQSGAAPVSSGAQVVDAVVAVATTPNRPLAVYRDAVTSRLHLGQCSSWGGCTYPMQRVLDALPVTQRAASIALDADGIAQVAYAAEGPGFGVLRLYSCNDASCTAGSSTEVDSQPVGTRTHLAAIRAEGATRMLIVYNSVGDMQVRYAACGMSCGSGAANLGMLVAGRDGFVLPAANAADGYDVVYTRPGGGLGLVSCNNRTCLLRQERTLLADTTLGHAPQAVRRADGSLLITHRDTTLGTLRMYRCNDVACSSGNDAALDSSSDMADAFALARGADDRAITFLRRENTAALLAARCDTPACASRALQASINGIDVQHADVAVRADGRPLVAWTHDVANGDTLWLQRCADPACSQSDAVQLGINSNYSYRPVLLLRPDGRPAVVASSVGGIAMHNCSDVDCTSNAEVRITAPGSGTGETYDAVVRVDGRVAVASVDRSNSGGTRNDVLLHLCDDDACLAPSTRVLADLSTSASVGDLAITADSANRAQVSFTYFETGLGAVARYIRCDDAACGTFTERMLAPGGAYGIELAMRSDDRAVLLQTLFPLGHLNICDSPGCSTDTQRTIPSVTSGASSVLRLHNNVPMQTGVQSSQVWINTCVDEQCNSPLLQQAADLPGTSLQRGGFAVDVQGRARIGAIDTQHRDVWLTVCAAPSVPEVFRDGFED